MFKTPHLMIVDANPVFDFELARIKRLAMPDRLWWYGGLVQVLPCVFIALLYSVQLLEAVYAYNTGASNNANLYYSYGYLGRFYNTTSTWVVILLFVVGLVVLAGSIYYLAVTVHSINQQINSGHWDMLRLTPMLDADIYKAKLATAEIRAWRLMNIEVALRLTLLTLVAMAILLPPDIIIRGQDYFSSKSIWGTLVNSLSINTFSTILVIILIPLAAIAWVWEPVWRMKTLLSVGLSISARITNLSLASLYAFFSFIGFCLGFLLLMYGWVSLVNMISLALWWRQYEPSGGLDVVTWNRLTAITQFLAVVGIIGVGYFYYAAIRLLAQRSTFRHAFRSE